MCRLVMLTGQEREIPTAQQLQIDPASPGANLPVLTLSHREDEVL